MILDVEKAFVDYLVTNMNSVVGHGNSSVTIFRRKFPDDTKSEGVTIFAELREAHESIDELELIGIRITTRAHKEYKAFRLIQNVDSILDKYVEKNLNDSYQLMTCNRNAGPNAFSGFNDNLYYETAFYQIKVRYRGNDA